MRLAITLYELEHRRLFLKIVIINYRTIFKEGLNRIVKRLDKISVALYGLRPRYITLDLVARTLLMFITIIISSYYNRYDLRDNKLSVKYL